MTTTEYTYSEEIISDLHKDARGFRPGEGFWEEWIHMDQDGKQQMWDYLVEEMTANVKAEQDAEREALDDFRNRLAQAMQAMGCDWKQAIRVMAEYAKEDVDCDQSFGYFLWDNGIGYEDRMNIIKLFKE